MKAQLLLAFPLLLAALTTPASAAEQTLVGWGQEWDYMQPMGTDPAIADPDFNTTWFQRASDFAVNYNGPSFGAGTFGNQADPSTFDSGTGPGPFGYDALDYFTVGGEMSSFGTPLTRPWIITEGAPANQRFAAYFRTTFTASQLYTAPRIRMLLDDSAMVYYDGTLIARVNQSVSNETYTYVSGDTTATLNETFVSANNEAVIQSFNLSSAGTSPTADSFVIVTLPTITAGSHTIAVSVRNNSATSSDMGMGLELRGDDSGISITPVVSNIARSENGTPADPNDDTMSFTLNVAATGAVSAAGWKITSPPALASTTGAYGVNQAITGVPLAEFSGAGRTLVLFIEDSANPAINAIASVSAPVIIGTKNFGTAQPLYSNNFGVPAGWNVDETALNQISTDSGAPAKQYRSEVINLEAIGVVSFSGTLQADDFTSGFETDDTFNAYLIINGNEAAPMSLITAYDVQDPIDGILRGAELTPATPGPPPITGPGSFTFPLSAEIPESANSVQLVIEGNENSGNELMTVHSLLFTSSGAEPDGLPDAWELANLGTLAEGPADDHDDDGATNLNEFNAGTDPADPLSQLTIVSVAPAAGGYQLTWTSVPGKTYRVDYSTDKTAWTDMGVDIPASAGSTTSANLPLGSPVPPRLFARVRVGIP